MSEQNPERVRHIIGTAKHQRSAVLVTAYLRERFNYTRYQPEAFTYSTDRDGVRRYSIAICDDEVKMQDGDLIIESCRAFLAGLGDGDIWA